MDWSKSVLSTAQVEVLVKTVYRSITDDIAPRRRHTTTPAPPAPPAAAADCPPPRRRWSGVASGPKRSARVLCFRAYARLLPASSNRHPCPFAGHSIDSILRRFQDSQHSHSSAGRVCVCVIRSLSSDEIGPLSRKTCSDKTHSGRLRSPPSRPLLDSPNRGRPAQPGPSHTQHGDRTQRTARPGVAARRAPAKGEHQGSAQP